MNYYTVLELTNDLIARHGWALQRCRRRCDGPARYIVVGADGDQVLVDKAHRGRRLGFTLLELLKCLCDNVEGDVAVAAENLLRQLSEFAE